MDEKDVCCVSCSGASDVGQNLLTIGLERRNKGNGYCLAGIGAFQDLLKA